MSVIEKLDEAIRLLHDTESDWGEFYGAAIDLLRDHGPAIRQAMIDARRLRAYRDATFDGNAVYAALDDRAKSRTSADNVADVLDALNRVARATGEGEGHD